MPQRALLCGLLLAMLIPLAAVVGWQDARRTDAAGRSASAEPVVDAETVAGCWHVVQPGENLRSIARRYYGSGRLWRTVQLANDVGLRPRPGVEVWVPGHLPELP